MPQLDEPAPDFVVDTNEDKISLSSFRGMWVVLFAYPADFTPICEMDIIGFARNKPKFDELGVQIIGWSVDTVESHQKWIKDLRERTGVQLEFPLIADADRKLAEKYGILHKAKGVTYRGVFIIDPDSNLRFSAVYPVEVGRSVLEVERIIKVLQRARELNRLADLDREKDLAGSASSVADEQLLDPLVEAERIILAGDRDGVVLRLIGGLAFRAHCHGKHAGHLREYRDMDLFGLGWHYEKIESVFKQLGYDANRLFNLHHGSTHRLQFLGRGDARTIDVFLDKFIMQHTIDFGRRVGLDDLTIPITDLLLTKLQMGVRLEAKDARDVVAILEDHELGRTDSKETLNIDYLSNLCSHDWGLCESVLCSMEKVRHVIEDDVSVQCVGMEAVEMLHKLDEIRTSIMSSRKGLRWKARGMLGTRVKWYNDVEKGAGEA